MEKPGIAIMWAQSTGEVIGGVVIQSSQQIEYLGGIVATAWPAFRVVRGAVMQGPSAFQYCLLDCHTASRPPSL